MGHEVGHALYTPADNWKKDYPDLPMSYVNILEDVRIEKLMKLKYAGIVKTFFNGYKELSSQDFFELEENDVEEMGLPDRINLNARLVTLLMFLSQMNKLFYRQSKKDRNIPRSSRSFY